MIQSRIDAFDCGSFHFYGCACFEKNGNSLLLGENGCVILLDNTLVRSLRDGAPSDALRFKLVQHGLAHVPGKVMFCCENEIEPTYFILDLTKKCNFDCIYCFRDLDCTDTISFEVLQDILDYIHAYCRKSNLQSISLQMWGGEPVLAMDRIQYVVDFFRESELTVTMDVETNASAVTPDIARKLHQWGIHVGVSLDGPPALHDRQRKLRSGKNSSALVECGVRNLQQYYGDDLGGICVITRYNYRHIREMIDYFYYGLGLKSMKFNLVRDNAHAGEHALGLSEEEAAQFADDLMKELLAYRRMGADFSEGNLELKVQNLLQRASTSFCISQGCQGGKKIISFDQQGNIFPCEMTDFQEEKIGSIYDNIELTKQIEIAANRNRFFLPKKDARCTDCPWWYFCRGGCSSRNHYAARDGKADLVECALNRVIYPQLVEWILDGYIE